MPTTNKMQGARRAPRAFALTNSVLRDATAGRQSPLLLLAATFVLLSIL